ncbi:unnamed protein product [Adineta ricciae]|uniref:Uncharacterized protein n=1 Tax=Adineta ricciae TaxID=249248 RepID=A0A815YT36_ADIRI|nr:unnamed protein product [Adineta ricciae]CAF1573902.1 unnamed protein product [Adineta ricciae]
MANFSSFDEQYRPAFHNKLDQNVVEFMQQNIDRAQLMNDADKAEKFLEEACDQCINIVTDHVKEIKESAKQKRASCKTPADEQKYTTFIQGVAAGVQAAQSKIDQIFCRIHDLITTVIGWIRKGTQWIANAISEAFTFIRSIFIK